jgi:tetratricopeptide (TPR) repeat protein
MRLRKLFYLFILAFALTVWAPFASSKNLGAYAQNTISGFVFGPQRKPVGEIYVELLNDYGQTVSRTRTNSAGYFTFSGMSEGRFVLRALVSSTDYEEGEKTVEITNFTSEDSQGRTRTSGYANEQVDIILKLRKGITPANAVVFAQDVPPEAQRLYEKAVTDLDNKRSTEAFRSLKAALEIFPKYYAALERLGTEYIILARPEAFQAAVVLFTNAVEVNPRAFKSWYGLAYSEYSLGKFPDALTAVQKAIEINAASAETVYLSGVLMKKVKKYDEAEKQLLKAQEISHDTIPRVHWELATLYGNILHRYADAANELKLFLKAQPGSKDAESIKKLIADFEAKAQKK